MPKPLNQYGVLRDNRDLKPNVYNKIASKTAAVYVEIKTNLGTQISSICEPVPWKAQDGDCVE